MSCLRSEKAGASELATLKFDPAEDQATVEVLGQKTTFDLKRKTIDGTETTFATLFKDQLRRNGIRFRYRTAPDGRWSLWGPGPLEYF